ncbi:MAG: 4a-hydroxytetrahydrobiopterin dehydratase [Nitrospinota bacterium]|nr:4a-hydroxytetrahydrobiopterin dehydratase [Nitrospinota bacterium]
MKEQIGACSLTDKKCVPCEGGIPPKTESEAKELLKQLDGWILKDGKIEKSFGFKDFYETIEFVNGVAWICNREGHHPDLEVSYNKCRVVFWTHAIGGLSENDFICAAKVDRLFE